MTDDHVLKTFAAAFAAMHPVSDDILPQKVLTVMFGQTVYVDRSHPHDRSQLIRREQFGDL